MQRSRRRPKPPAGCQVLVVLAVGTCLSLLANRTAAQEATRLPEEPSLELVVVTGTKRKEDPLGLPSSVWVATERRLESSLVRDFDDLARIAPLLTITKTTQPANNSINIRGVGTYAFSIATKPSVSVVVDGVPQAFQAQAFAPLGDVEQVEILRGPQSTLFGTSATAGVIVITTKMPDTTPTLGGRVMATNDGEQRISGFVSGPITATLRARIFAGSVSYRGNLYNNYSDNWVNGHDDLAGHATLVWEPSNLWALKLSSRWIESRSSCCTSAAFFVSPDVTFGRFQGYSAPQDSILAGITPGPNNRVVSADVEPEGNATDRGASLQVERRMGGHSIASITGLGRYDLEDRQDTDGTSFNWGPGGAEIPGAIQGGSANGGSFRVNSLSTELRVTSPAENRLRYVAAMYFSQVETWRDFVRGSNDLQRYGDFPNVPPSTSAYSTYATRARARNHALFATSTFNATSRLGVVTGLRLNRELLDYSLTDRVNQLSFGSPGCSGATPSGLPASTCDDFNSLTGKAAITYALAPASMLFFSYDRGYKGAAYDLTSNYTTRSLVTAPGATQGYPVADAVAFQQPVAPETVDSFQLGWKVSMSEKWRLGLTLFDAKFHNYQAQSRDELTRQNVLNSVESVRTRGVEVELTASPMRFLQLNAAGAFNDATTRKFRNAPCYSSQTPDRGCLNGTQDLSGQSLANSPRWTFNLDANLAVPVSSDVRLSVDTGFQWRSRIMHSLTRDPASRQGSYGVLNLAVGIERRDWKLRAFVVNVLNKNFSLSKSRDGNWNINPYGASTGVVSDAVKWAPGRDSARYLGVEISVQH